MTSTLRETGTTLIEMIVSIVIISVFVTAAMMVVTQVGRSSADPMIRTQAAAIAQAYLDEILVQALNDPEGGESGSAELGETRSTFDDVSDYHGLADTAGAVDQRGASIAGLEGYNIDVSVTASTIGGYPAKRIFVRVGFDGDPNLSVPIVAYRMN